MKSTKLIALLIVVVMCVTMFASCGLFGNKPDNGGEGNQGGNTPVDPDTPDVPKTYTYNDYLTISPSNWNELTYQDNNDTNVMSWIGSSFFGFDFKYDENGEIIPGEFEVVFNAATALEDVTHDVDAEKWGIKEDDDDRAWKITLRNDLKWENGDPIKAEDFVYTMMEQLNPLFQNYRADSYYNSAQSLVGAKSYAKQGQAGLGSASGGEYSEARDAELVFSFAPAGAVVNGNPVLEVIGIRAWLEGQLPSTTGYSAAQMVENVFLYNFGADMPAFTKEVAAEMEGKTFAEIKANDVYAAAWADLIGWWQTLPNEELDFFLMDSEYPEFSFENVGIYAASEYELVIILEKSLDLLNEDGTLGYKAAYNLASLPLVHKATYEANKVAPQEGSELWTSIYNSSVETTMSWGPYKLTSFQTGMQFTLDRNENWYGYGLEENEGLYQTDRIVYDIVKDWNSAWLLFQAGKLDGIGIDVSIADEYKNSDQAFFTPSDYVGSLQLQSSKEALKEREEDGENKTILSYVDFRKAISLSIDRADYNAKCTTSSKAGFGLFNSMHYYDVPNGGVFRNTDEAKKVLCEIYAVDWTDTEMYPTLDDAVEAISGYNPTEAKALMTKAYNEALAAGDISETDKVVLTFGTGAVNDVVTRRYEYLAAAIKKVAEGTPLEGRIELEIEDHGDAWADDFRAGGYDICMGGWTGAAWDPGYFLLAYLSEDYMYSAAWETDKITMTFTMKGVGEDGADITDTMTLLEWYDCLNGNSGCKYNWGSGVIEENLRLQLIAALEKEVLKVYYTVPLQNEFSASLISYQVDYITYEYNTFMGYGGIKYMTYNFDDAAWAAEVEANGNNIDYR